MLKVKHLEVINQLKLTTMTLAKNRKEALSKYDSEKAYSLEDASKIVKDVTKVKATRRISQRRCVDMYFID